jgi:hypothetical protein
MGSMLWLTIDEMSMLTTPQLLYLSQVAGMVRSSITMVKPSILFGGLSMILFGNLHQFLPVANQTRELYCLYPPNDNCALR